jgi:Skp family chaperone for outer membrane proteins
MKRVYSILMFLIACTSIAFAQENRKEEIEKFRKEYFTRQLNLSADEAKKFWPVYNEMQSELQKIHKEKRSRMRAIREDFNSMTDAELEKALNEELANRQKELDIEKKYHDRFKSILGIKKLALYYRAQEGFKRELLRKIKDKGGRGPGGPEND